MKYKLAKTENIVVIMYFCNCFISVGFLKTFFQFVFSFLHDNWYCWSELVIQFDAV